MGNGSRQLEFERKMRQRASSRTSDLIAKLLKEELIEEVSASRILEARGVAPVAALDVNPWEDLEIIWPELFPLHIGGEYHGFVLEAYYHDRSAVGLTKGERGYIVPFALYQMILWESRHLEEFTNIDVRYKSFVHLIASGAIHQAANLVLGVKRVATRMTNPLAEPTEERLIRLAIRAHKFRNMFEENSVAYQLGAGIILYVLFKNADASTQKKIEKAVHELGGVIKAWSTQKVQEYALKFVGKVITNQVIIRLVRRAAGIVATSPGYSGFLFSIGGSIRNGLILFAFSIHGEVERAELGSKQLKKEIPFLYDLLRPHDLDLLWFMLADTFDALEERIVVLLKEQGIEIAR